MTNIDELIEKAIQVKALAGGLTNTITDINETGNLKKYEFERQYEFMFAVLSAIISASSCLIDELEQTKTPVNDQEAPGEQLKTYK